MPWQTWLSNALSSRRWCQNELTLPRKYLNMLHITDVDAVRLRSGQVGTEVQRCKIKDTLYINPSVRIITRHARYHDIFKETYTVHRICTGHMFIYKVNVIFYYWGDSNWFFVPLFLILSEMMFNLLDCHADFSLVPPPGQKLSLTSTLVQTWNFIHLFRLKHLNHIMPERMW